MTGMISWLVYAVAGGVFMVAMKWTPKWLDVVLVRLAGAAFVAAGIAGLTGWVGSLTDTLLGWASNIADQAAIVIVGAVVVWMAVAVTGLAWIGGMLPDKLFRLDPPDWLVVSGLVLPSLVVVVPGAVGDFLQMVFLWVGDLFAQPFAQLVT